MKPKRRRVIGTDGSVRGARSLERLRGRASEAELHRLLLRLGRGGKGVVAGIGHDVAVVRSDGAPLALKVDPTVEGVHFGAGLRDAAAIARKAIRRPASDLAAAGAIPAFALASADLPPGTSARFAAALARSVASAARSIGAALVGGHTGVRPGPLQLTVTLVGRFDSPPRTRAGARPGDVLLATGAFGGSILGKHLRFRPRLRESLALARAGVPVRAAIDVSDGLALDATRLAGASRVALELDARAIPISAAARAAARSDGRSPLSHALGDGEDYELLLAIAPRDVSRALRVARRARFALAPVGVFRRGRGLRLRRGPGRVEPLPPAGFLHRA